MEKILEFIKECKVFYFSTVSGDEPRTRPFGAIMLDGDNFYVTTGKKGNTYKQVLLNPNVQIVALLNGTRNWVRITGKVRENTDIKKKEKMFIANPILEKRYNTVMDENLALLELYDIKVDTHFVK